MMIDQVKGVLVNTWMREKIEDRLIIKDTTCRIEIHPKPGKILYGTEMAALLEKFSCYMDNYQNETHFNVIK